VQRVLHEVKLTALPSDPRKRAFRACFRPK
jgi:hypothetical protein